MPQTLTVENSSSSQTAQGDRSKAFPGFDETGTRCRFVYHTLLAVTYAGLIWMSFRLDDTAVEILARPIESGQMKNILRNLRCWGEGSTVVILSIGWLFAAPKRWPVALGMALAALGVGITVELVKPMTARARPAYALNPTTAAQSDRNSSFPSGHTATAFAVARVWSYAMPSVRPICLFAAFGTGLSRMYDQRHYFSDCVVGGIFGWYFAAAVASNLARVLRPRRTPSSGKENVTCQTGFAV